MKMGTSWKYILFNFLVDNLENYLESPRSLENGNSPPPNPGLLYYAKFTFRIPIIHRIFSSLFIDPYGVSPVMLLALMRPSLPPQKKSSQPKHFH